MMHQAYRKGEAPRARAVCAGSRETRREVLQGGVAGTHAKLRICYCGSYRGTRDVPEERVTCPKKPHVFGPRRRPHSARDDGAVADHALRGGAHRGAGCRLEAMRWCSLGPQNALILDEAMYGCSLGPQNTLILED
eukprot:gene15912-biopygen5002